MILPLVFYGFTIVSSMFLCILSIHVIYTCLNGKDLNNKECSSKESIKYTILGILVLIISILSIILFVHQIHMTLIIWGR